MPEAKRPQPQPPPKPATGPPVDPQLALAQKYMAEARAKLAEEEARDPRSRRRAAGKRSDGFTFSIAPATFLHAFLSLLGMTFVFEAWTLTYHMLHVDLTVGRVVALGTGMLSAAVLGYVSVCYLGIIESTSAGQTNVDSLSGDWREWFWTLPASFGMFALSAALGWILSLILPANVWFLIALSLLVTYPVFQLSSLETGTPLQPLSLPVLLSFLKHPMAWLVLYGVSFAVINVVWLVMRAAWMDPPYGTMLVVAPVVTVALFFYAWLLGQVAAVIGRGEET